MRCCGVTSTHVSATFALIALLAACDIEPVAVKKTFCGDGTTRTGRGDSADCERIDRRDDQPASATDGDEPTDVADGTLPPWAADDDGQNGLPGTGGDDDTVTGGDDTAADDDVFGDDDVAGDDDIADDDTDTGNGAITLTVDAPLMAGVHTVQIDVSAPEGLIDVSLYVGEQLRTLDPVGSQAAEIDTTPFPDGPRTLRAVARWSDGREASDSETVEFDNTGPAMKLIAPAPGQGVLPEAAGRVTLIVEFSDAHGVGAGDVRVIAEAWGGSVAQQTLDGTGAPSLQMAFEADVSNALPPDGRWNEGGSVFDVTGTIADALGNVTAFNEPFRVDIKRWSYEADAGGSYDFAPRGIPGSDDVMLVQSLPDGTTRVTVVNPGTGEVTNEFTLDGKQQSLYARPDGSVIILQTLPDGTTELTAINADGSMKYATRWSPGVDVSGFTLTAEGDILIVTASGPNGEAECLKLNGSNASLLWSYPIGGKVSQQPLTATQGYLLGRYSNNGLADLLVMLDAATGSELWRNDLDGDGFVFSSVLPQTNQILLYDRTPAGRCNRVKSIDADSGFDVWTAAAPDGESNCGLLGGGEAHHWYFRTPDGDDRIIAAYGYDLATGAQVFEFRYGNTPFVWAHPPDGDMLIAPYPHTNDKPFPTFRYNVPGLFEEWRTSFEGWPVIQTGPRLFLADHHPADGRERSIMHVALDTGAAGWQYIAENGEVFSMGLYYDNEMYLAQGPPGLGPTRIVALDADNGDFLWSYPLGDSFALGSDGTLYRLRRDGSGKVTGIDAIRPVR